MKKITFLITLLISFFGFSQNLITNGNFESGSAGWSGNALNVVTENGNSYSSANVIVAGNPYDVNLSYVTPMLTAGTNYRLTFTAWSDRARTLVVGLGLNEGPWTNVTQTINLTATAQTFVLDFTTNFASANSRIIFDMGAAVGFVGIDNVSLIKLLPLIQNFETPITYASVAGFEGASATIAADPVSGGTNGQVFKGVQGPTGNPWQGIEFVQTAKKAKLTTNKTMTVDVYCSQAFNILAKVDQGGVGVAASATAQAYTTPGQWQTLTFNFA